MINIKVDNQYLDLFENTSIAIESESPIWFGGDIETIPGTVMIPFEIPFSKSNVAILGFVNHLGNRKKVTQIENVVIELNGNVHLSGTFVIENSNKTSISVKLYAGVGALQTFKTTYLNDPSLYEVDDYYTLTTATMNAALSGTDVLYVPYWSDDVLINGWGADGQTFISNINVVPAFSALFLLEKLIDGQGWTLDWRDKEAYRTKLQLMTNQGKSFYFNLTEVLPKVLVSDFIKEIAILTGHYIEINSIDNIMTFKKYSDVGKGNVLDWTDKVVDIDGNEMITVAFDFDGSNHVYDTETETETKTYGSGTITYNRTYLEHKKEIVTSFLVDNNLESVHLFWYNGLQDSEYILGTGNISDVEALQYPAAESISNIETKYTAFINKVNESESLTITATLSPNAIKSITFNQIIRIFNANDGSYFNFLIKSIKQSINISQHEVAELEIVQLQ